jgi:hypothetical protein
VIVADAVAPAVGTAAGADTDKAVKVGKVAKGGVSVREGKVRVHVATKEPVHS